VDVLQSEDDGPVAREVPKRCRDRGERAVASRRIRARAAANSGRERRERLGGDVEERSERTRSVLACALGHEHLRADMLGLVREPTHQRALAHAGLS
jgi:hypothetical protein